MSRDYVLQPFRTEVRLQIDYAAELNEQQHAAVTLGRVAIDQQASGRVDVDVVGSHEDVTAFDRLDREGAIAVLLGELPERGFCRCHHPTSFALGRDRQRMGCMAPASFAHTRARSRDGPASDGANDVGYPPFPVGRRPRLRRYARASPR